MSTTRIRRVDAATAESSIDTVMALLMRDPDFVIATVVANNYPAVAARYTSVMGNSAPTAKPLTAELQRMRAGGQGREVTAIISVPWLDNGDTPLHTAVRTLRAESQARLNDPNNAPAIAKMGVFDPSTFDPTGEYAATAIDGGAVPGNPTNGAAGSGGAFWNSLPGILTSMGGLVGAFTGHLPSTNTGGPYTPPPKPATNWMRVALVVLGIAAVITVIAVVVKRTK